MMFVRRARSSGCTTTSRRRSGSTCTRTTSTRCRTSTRRRGSGRWWRRYGLSRSRGPGQGGVDSVGEVHSRVFAPRLAGGFVVGLGGGDLVVEAAEKPYPSHLDLRHPLPPTGVPAHTF